MGKSLVKSKTVIGILISLAGTLAPMLGYAVDTNTLTGLVDEFFQIAGLVLAFYGRVKATDPITKIV